MISKYYTTEYAQYTLVYNLDAYHNMPYMILHEVEYKCLCCKKNAYVNFEDVPVQDISIVCDACDADLFVVDSTQFDIELTEIPCAEEPMPEDEGWDDEFLAT